MAGIATFTIIMLGAWLGGLNFVRGEQLGIAFGEAVMLGLGAAAGVYTGR